MLTIYSFLSPPKEDVTRALQEAANKDRLSAVKELGALGASLIGKTIEDEIADLLDISLVGLMLRAWKKYELVRKYIGKGAPETAEKVLVPLLDHTIESSHSPYIQISRAGVPILKIKFSVELEIAVEGLILKLGSGRIQEVTASRFVASGSMKCEGVTIVEKKSQPLNLPASFAVAPEDEADREEERSIEPAG
jgi:hypothetical protein